ncbi:hypothetical protein [Amycolatopsis circi]|uniref:hypothetical protein n=1 Tax=Amycolatopsis circi TaxID=871959 RepID=UPI0013BEA58C|nr:hypothetical protein [Amycolatopsis circi]
MTASYEESPAFPEVPDTMVSASGGDHSSVYAAGRDLTILLGKALGLQSLQPELQQVQTCYAPIAASEWAQVVKAWRASRLVIITGPPRVGKRTAALRLLSQRDSDTKLADFSLAGVRELRKDWETPDVGMLPVLPGTYLLDLGETPAETLPEDFGEGLRSFVEDPAHTKIRLVVTMTDDASTRCASSLHQQVARVTRPSPTDVVKAHLQLLDHETRAEWIDHEPLDTLLTADSSPRDAVSLARAIAHAPDPGTDKDKILASVADEFRRWSGYLTAKFNGQNRKADDVALFIAAAVVDGAPPDVVWKAAMTLLGPNRLHPTVEQLLLEDDLETRLRAITGHGNDAALDRVSLDVTRRGISTAVLPHLWRQRPQLVPALLAWIQAITGSDGVAKEHLPAIGERLAVLAETHPGAGLVDTFLKWAEKDIENRQLVAALLTRLAGDGAVGTEIRRRTWDAAYNYHKRTTTTTSTHEAAVVAEMCAGRFAIDYPNETLVRLKWLLDGPASEDVHAPARRALRKLCTSTDQVMALLRTALAWRKEAPNASARVVLYLLDPDDGETSLALLELAERQPEVLEAVRAGWGILLEANAVRRETAKLIREWLTAVPSGALPPEPTKTVLAEVLRTSVSNNEVAKAFLPEGADDVQGQLMTEIIAKSWQ